MLKTTAILGAIVLMAGCAGSKLTPEQRADLAANIERNKPMPPVMTADGGFSVSIAKSRAVAFVSPVTQLPTIARIEAAASEASGCTAKAIGKIYEDTGNMRDASIPRATIGGFRGQLPVILTC